MKSKKPEKPAEPAPAADQPEQRKGNLAKEIAEQLLAAWRANPKNGEKRVAAMDAITKGIPKRTAHLALLNCQRLAVGLSFKEIEISR